MPSTSETSNRRSLLNDFLNSLEEASIDDDNGYDWQLKKAFAEIDNYNPKSIDVDKDIMLYWEETKYMYPFLYQLAKVVHSVPATQVSVERSFSALKLILTDLRCNLSSESLKKILFVKLNK